MNSSAGEDARVTLEMIRGAVDLAQLFDHHLEDPLVGSEQVLQVPRGATLLGDLPQLGQDVTVGPAPHYPGGERGVLNDRLLNGQRGGARPRVDAFVVFDRLRQKSE